MTNVLVGSFIVYFFAARITRIEFELYSSSLRSRRLRYVTRYERQIVRYLGR